MSPLERPTCVRRHSSNTTSPHLRPRRSSITSYSQTSTIRSTSHTRGHGTVTRQHSNTPSVISLSSLNNIGDHLVYNNHHRAQIPPKSPRLLTSSNPTITRNSSHTRFSLNTAQHRSFQSNDINEDNIDSVILNVNLDNSLPTDYFKQDILSVIKSLKIPKWRKIEKSNYKQIGIDRISGAMTNCVYKLTYSNYYPLLLRIYGDMEDIIDRNSELLTLVRLSRKNIGPKLLGCFSNGRFEEFLNNSITLNKSQIRDQKISRMIARRMKEFHSGVELSFDEINQGPKSWILIERWIEIVDQIIQKENADENTQKSVFMLNWESFKHCVFIYKDWLFSKYDVQTLKDSLRFCHNDAQYGNLLFYNKSDALSMDDDDDTNNNKNNDGNYGKNSTSYKDTIVADSEITNLSLDQLSIGSHSTNQELPLITEKTFENDTKLTVIDFEYAGQNPAAYDIANHFCEWMYDYHDPVENYKTNELKYPSVEDRINYLNSYVKYVPGSTTPNFKPVQLSELHHEISENPPKLIKSIKLSDLPSQVKQLYNDIIYWRSTSSIFWALWAVISRGSISSRPVLPNNTENFEFGPNGETYKIVSEFDQLADCNSSEDEYLEQTLDDEFDRLKYALGKTGIFIGDMIQLGLLEEKDVDTENKSKIKYLDVELLPI